MTKPMQIVLRHSDTASEKKQYLCPSQSTVGYSSVVTINIPAFFDHPVVTGSGQASPCKLWGTVSYPRS